MGFYPIVEETDKGRINTKTCKVYEVLQKKTIRTKYFKRSTSGRVIAKTLSK